LKRKGREEAQRKILTWNTSECRPTNAAFALLGVLRAFAFPTPTTNPIKKAPPVERQGFSINVQRLEL